MWRPVVHESGKTYYFNDETQQSVWEKPLELQTPLERALAGSDWREYKAENGREYYYNVKSQESVWEIPKDIQAVIDAESVKKKKKEEEEEEVVRSPETKPEVKINDRSKLTDENEKYHNSSELLKPSTAMTLEQGEQVFIDMLRESGVDATWSFSKVMDTFISTPQYWALEDSLHKKRVFEQYLSTRTREELMKENMSVEKFKLAFVNLLKSKPEIKYYTRWQTTKKLIQDEPIYAHSVISERVKRLTFTEYVDSLRQAHDESHDKLKTQALSELTDYLKSMNLNVSSTWSITVQQIKKDPRFEQNKHFTILTQLDLLTVFESTMEDLVSSQKELIKQISRKNYRSDRKARDGFRELLSELKESGLFKVNTPWSEVYELIQEDDRYLELLDRNGSTAMELFQDAIDEEELIIRGKQALAEQILIKNDITVLEDSPVSLIQGVLSKEEQTKDIDEDTVEIIHERLIREVLAQKERDRFARQRQQRRYQDEFKTYLRLFVPIITIDTKWEDVQPKMSLAPEYLAVDEQDRELVFNKFIDRLKEARAENSGFDVKKVLANVVNQKKRQMEPLPAVELDY